MKKIIMLALSGLVMTTEAQADVSDWPWSSQPVYGTCWLRPEGGFETVDPNGSVYCRIICLCTIFGNQATSAIEGYFDPPATLESLDAACAAVTSDPESWEYTCELFMTPQEEEEETEE